jgi:hypothetical protein
VGEEGVQVVLREELGEGPGMGLSLMLGREVLVRIIGRQERESGMGRRGEMKSTSWSRI